MKNILTSISFLLICVTVNAQKSKLYEGNKSYDNIAYIDAIKTYERVAAKGFKSAELFQKLGNSLYFNGKLKEANKWYEQLFGRNEPLEAEYYYRYSQTLKAVGDYDKANEYLEQFHKISLNDIRGNLFENQKNYRKIIEKNSGRFEIKPAAINSNVSDYGIAFFGDYVIFSTARDSISYAKTRSRWTSNAFTNLYYAERQDDGTLQNPKPFSNAINSDFNESTPVFTKDLKTVYFTRNNFNNGVKGFDKDKKILLKLYKAKFVNDKWTNVQELPFNDNSYSVAHPALSPDEKTLYFASDMPGTKGQSDIFKVDILENETYGTPVNIESGINTEGRETFPFISAENELYFASDGHPGLGGLDIFVSKFSNQGELGKVFNIGEPVNSPVDDFSYIINTFSRKGYFASNREGGTGLDDIYYFLETKPLLIDYKHDIEGAVSDGDTKEVLKGAKITLLDENFKVMKEVLADENGAYKFEVVANKKYYVRSEKEGFDTKEESIVIPNMAGKTTLNITSTKTLKAVKLDTDLAKTFNVKSIVFDSGKFDIREDAKVELAKIVDAMKQYPNMKIDVRSHTDSRQPAKLNLKLSQKRANATVRYLIESGIDASRLTAKGYGESELINKCKDGVECTPEEHEINRRSEFIITAM
ncbi:MAG: OmpA family protein [Bacteroidota bacterium]